MWIKLILRNTLHQLRGETKQVITRWHIIKTPEFITPVNCENDSKENNNT